MIAFAAVGLMQAESVIGGVSVLPGATTTAYAGYGSSYAIDGSSSTDYASNGGAAGTQIAFDLGGLYQLTTANYTDRTSSGGGNGSNAMGFSDYVTQYTYSVYTGYSGGNTFTGFQGSVTYSHSTPAGPATLASFQHFGEALPNVLAQYIVFNVNTTNGSNPGGAEWAFFAEGGAVPEPATLMLVGLTCVALGAVRKVRQS